MSQIQLSKRTFYAVTCVTIIAFVAVIVGVTVGLTREPSNSKKLETCSKFACDDSANFFQELNKKCPESIELLGQTTVLTPTTSPSPVKLNYRLPSDLVPNHYDIMLDVQFENQTNDNKSFPYNGFVRIDFTCVRETDQLVFHMNKINITRVTLKGINDTNFDSDLVDFKWSFEEKLQFFQASLPKAFKKSLSYSVLIHYTGYLQDDNVGFYRSSYVTKDGIKRWLMTSQMEPTDARKAFPCFDEPAFKATFLITVLHPSEYHAISNMAVNNTSIDGSRTKTVFQITPRMSTYLIGLVVSDFKCKNGTAYAPDKVDVRVCAKPEAYDELDYSLDVGCRVLEFFYKLLGVEYPLSKLDHLAIPDFAAGNFRQVFLFCLLLGYESF
jgi:aminopeptidase N